MNELQTYDVIILGGGPAGISCALELHESKVNYILIDRNPKLGGQLSQVKNTIRNFAARFWDSGIALRDDMESLCKKIGVVTRLSETITKTDLADKMLFGSRYVYRGKTIFLATGTRPRVPAIHGADKFQNNIILYVEENERYLSGKSIAVIGGGDNALMDCLWLAKRCPFVLLIHRSDHFKARPDMVAEVLKNPKIKVMKKAEVKSVSGEKGKLTSITIKDNLTEHEMIHPVEYLVLRVGFTANTEAFSGQIKMDNAGLVLIDQTCQTSIEGVFAGGDLVAPECPGVARSVGQGLVAARTMCKYLVNHRI